MYHVHYDSRSKDCDGAYEHSHVWFPNPEDYPSEFEGDDVDEYLVEAFVLRGMIPLYDTGYPVATHLTYEGVKFDDDTGEEDLSVGRTIIDVSYETDEGFHSEQAILCHNPDCDPNEKATQRDHTAEAMGY
jgi:hypothetical protein